MTRIAVANQKGGVGKTTTAINLIASLALSGKKCLLIDLDAQGNATTGLGQSRVDSYDLESGLPTAIPTGVDGIDILPASQTYGSQAVAVSLGRALAAGLPEDYDFIVFDCPPALAGVTRSALNVATDVLIPIQCEYFSLEGLDSALRAVQAAQRQDNPSLKLLGILLTMYDIGQEYCEAVKEEVVKHFPGQVLQSIIPRDVTLSEATSHGQPITIYDPRSRGCLGYTKLAKEVLNA